MRIGCPKEIKTREYRVGLTPTAAREAVAHGHRVLVEARRRRGLGVSRTPTIAAVGAEIVAEAAEVWARAELVVKVKEPQAAERAMLRAGQVLFAYLHLAPDPEQTRDLLASGVTAIAYETVTDAGGGLPLLAPMSEVAGRLAPQVGAWTLQTANGGRGVLLGGVPGVAPGEGGGDRRRRRRHPGGAGGGGDGGGGDGARPVAAAAAGARRDVRRAGADAATPRRAATEAAVAAADLVIGAVLIPGAAAPKLVQPGAARADAAGGGGGRRGDRPGRLLRDLAADDARGPDLCGRRHPALLRRQHAGGGGADRDAWARERDAAVRAGARRQGLAAGVRGGPAPARRAERPCRAPDLRGGRAGARDRRAERRSWR